MAEQSVYIIVTDTDRNKNEEEIKRLKNTSFLPNYRNILRGVFDETTALVDAFTRKGGRMSEELLELLTSDNIEAALDKLPKDDFIIQSQARLARLNQDKDKGILSNDNMNLERNKIVNSLLSYLSDENRRFSGKTLK